MCQRNLSVRMEPTAAGSAGKAAALFGTNLPLSGLESILSYVLVYAEPVCTLLTLLLLPLGLKLTGVWLAVPLAQVITFVIAWAAKGRVDSHAETA